MKKCFFVAMAGSFLLAASAVAGDSAKGEKFSASAKPVIMWTKKKIRQGLI